MGETGFTILIELVDLGHRQQLKQESLMFLWHWILMASHTFIIFTLLVILQDIVTHKILVVGVVEILMKLEVNLILTAEELQ